MHGVLAELQGTGAVVSPESWTDETAFDPTLRERLATLLADADGSPAPVSRPAGHDAGILALASVPSNAVRAQPDRRVALPGEYAEAADCLLGSRRWRGSPELIR